MLFIGGGGGLICFYKAFLSHVLLDPTWLSLFCMCWAGRGGGGTHHHFVSFSWAECGLPSDSHLVFGRLGSRS